MKKNSKRLFVLILIGVLATGFVFASKSSISVQASPFAYQKVRFDNDWNYSSSFGFGARVSYKYNPSESFAMGLSSSILDFKILGDRYLVFSITGEIGVIAEITETIDLYFDMGLGADYRVYRGLKQFYPAYSLGFGSDYYVAEPLAFTFGAELRFCQQENEIPEFSSTDYNLVYYVGLKAKL